MNCGPSAVAVSLVPNQVQDGRCLTWGRGNAASAPFMQLRPQGITLYEHPLLVRLRIWFAGRSTWALESAATLSSRTETSRAGPHSSGAPRVGRALQVMGRTIKPRAKPRTIPFPDRAVDLGGRRADLCPEAGRWPKADQRPIRRDRAGRFSNFPRGRPDLCHRANRRRVRLEGHGSCRCRANPSTAVRRRDDALARVELQMENPRERDDAVDGSAREVVALASPNGPSRVVR